MQNNDDIAQLERITHTESKKMMIAYFTMEIAIDPRIPTYSGGLGVLAADTIKSFADINIPSIAVTLLYKKGYFYQKIDAQGQQEEKADNWNIEKLLEKVPGQIELEMEGRQVFVQAWKYTYHSDISGYNIPIIYLDVDMELNHPDDRSLSNFLYGGDEKTRIKQEWVLGVGGVRFLRKLEFNHITKFHMNEGHSAFLTIELLRERYQETKVWKTEEVKKLCVFTTHTPVEAGHDKFSYGLVNQVIKDDFPLPELKKLGGDDHLNMTLLALNLSHYINGVAKEHQKETREMFPGYTIDYVTNGIHAQSWVCECFKDLYTRYIRGWAKEPFSFRYGLNIPKIEIWNAHVKAKTQLFKYIYDRTKIELDIDVLTIGFARRATAYKRADLIFYDIDRLRSISKRAGKIQLIFAGKAHPKDIAGKKIIEKIIEQAHSLQDALPIVYLENYDIDLAKLIIPGVDLWLNTPQRPKEASGTSGMKAALNGVPSLSILDGWWIEGCIEGVTGWAIGSLEEEENIDQRDAGSLYEKLETTIIPLFYWDRNKWTDVMRHAIAINASFFNTHRMVQQYVLNAYIS